MARPREFGIETAIRKAMNVFWKHGYHGATLPDLLEGMQIARGSFYKAFDGKKPLFMSALDLYELEAVKPAVAMLSGPKDVDGWDRITALFDMVVGAVVDGDRRGCLLCTAAAGPATNDPEIATAVGLALDKMRDGFKTALEASNAHAHLSPAKKQALADTLTAQYVGLRILARSNASEETLMRSVSSIRGLSDLHD